jgi:hypothetical protein
MIRLTKRVGLLSASLLVIAALPGCDCGVLDPAGPVSAAERKILFDSLAIMLAIIIPVIIATLGDWMKHSSDASALLTGPIRSCNRTPRTDLLRYWRAVTPRADGAGEPIRPL